MHPGLTSIKPTTLFALFGQLFDQQLAVAQTTLAWPLKPTFTEPEHK
jgi:hypothetical protein